jgi:hypothetical protein
MTADFRLWGLGGAVVTELILTALKRIWVDAEGKPVIKDRWAVVASILVGIALSAAAAAGQLYPVVQSALEIVGGGLLAGLAACGMYSAVKSRK